MSAPRSPDGGASGRSSAPCAPHPQLAIAKTSAVSCDSAFCRQAGVLWATVVVKATFELVHEGTARLAAPESVRRADEARPGGGSILFARENAPHVPNAGVVLAGHACAPEGRAVSSMSVRLGISRDRPLIDKTLHVYGSRSVSAPSAVTPFQKLPLVYERAYGGAGVWENPVGTGGPGSALLPNIVDPRDPRRVAGFGPLAGQWAPRRAMLGGADRSILDQPVLEVPPGFDWRYFQAAPADQQLDALRGDEWIVLDGMHPAMPRVQTRLPQAKAHARRVPRSGGEAQPIALRADLLAIDADRGIASLVWRGRFPVPSVDALASVVVQACLELPGRPVEWPAVAPAPSAVAETQEVNLAAMFGGRLPFDAGRESALPAAAAQAPRAQPLSTGTAMVDVAKVLQGSVPFKEAAATADLPALVPSAHAGAGASTPAATAMEIPALNVRPLPFAPAAQDKPPAASVAARPANEAGAMSTGTTDIDLGQLFKAAAPFAAAGAQVSVASPPMPMEQLQPDLSTGPARSKAAPAGFMAAPPAANAILPDPVASTPPDSLPAITGAVVAPEAFGAASLDVDGVRGALLERLEKREPLDGLKLSAADLRDIDFKEVSLDGLDLHRAKLQNAKLGRASLRGARLAGADLTGADLSGADLTKSDLSRTLLDGARLDGARLTGARLTDARGNGARFDDATMAEADLSGAALSAASFKDVDAPGSLWDRAVLTGATLLGARLRGASFSRCALGEACLSEADLRSACLWRASGEGTDLREAKLEAADLRQAELPGATFDDADLRDVCATKANLSGARFYRADLSSANLRAAKLTGADFTHATLDGADLRDADTRDIKLDPTATRAAKIRLPR